MIPKNEILNFATQLNLNPHVVEKDYVLGWLLAGIAMHHSLKHSWVFKGGTCLKKCYFETYRFSEDLDFTVRDASHMDSLFLHTTFVDIAKWIYDNSGIEVPSDRMIFDIHTNPRGKQVSQCRIFYRGPVTAAGRQAMPRIKLDLSPDEIIADTPVERPLTHDYSDKTTGGIHVLSYTYAEVFAEKIRALLERTRPRDLYDVVNFIRRPESIDLAPNVSALLVKKCRFKGISIPSSSDLDGHKEACESGWKEQLSHQLQRLPPFESFWGELPSFFRWLDHQHATKTLRRSPITSGATPGTFFLRSHAASSQLAILDKIRFAAVNRLFVELNHSDDSGERNIDLIEPYSVRISETGHVNLYAVKVTASDSIQQTFRIDKIITANVLERAFTPSYAIDFLPEIFNGIGPSATTE